MEDLRVIKIISTTFVVELLTVGFLGPEERTAFVEDTSFISAK